jgi:hypothetical protein
MLLQKTGCHLALVVQTEMNIRMPVCGPLCAHKAKLFCEAATFESDGVP